MREHPLCRPGNHLGTGPGCSRPGQRGGVSVRLCTSTHTHAQTHAHKRSAHTATHARVHTHAEMHARMHTVQKCMHTLECTCPHAAHTHTHMHTRTRSSSLCPARHIPSDRSPAGLDQSCFPAAPAALAGSSAAETCRDIPQDPAGSCPALCCVSCRSKVQGANGCPVPRASPGPTGRELTPLQGK